MVESDDGNPAPAAIFSGVPVKQNYEIPLESYAFRGDLMQVGTIRISFDIKLTSLNSTGSEQLILQKRIGNIWHGQVCFTNESGSFDWAHQDVPLFAISQGGPVFKLRFLATGINSADISSWSIDNIHVYRTCYEAQDLELEENPDYNELSWIPSFTGCYDRWIHWDDGVNSGNSIGTGAAVEFDVAARWEPAQLMQYSGSPITEIAFFPAENQADYNVRIWTGDSIVNLIIDQPVTYPLIGQWNYITISTPFLIDATQDLWVGYHVNAQTGYPAGVDNGPAVNSYGNMMFWEGIWRTLLQINPELDFNWNIAFHIGKDPELPDFTYKIYRETNSAGFEFYDFTNELEYQDSNIYLPDFYCYKVTMLWTNDGDTCESAPTNEVCEIVMLQTNALEEGHPIKIYPNPSKDWLNIEVEEDILQIRFYSLLGELIMESDINQPVHRLDVSDFPNGVYYLVVETDKRRITEKAVILK